MKNTITVDSLNKGQAIKYDGETYLVVEIPDKNSYYHLMHETGTTKTLSERDIGDVSQARLTSNFPFLKELQGLIKDIAKVEKDLSTKQKAYAYMVAKRLRSQGILSESLFIAGLKSKIKSKGYNLNVSVIGNGFWLRFEKAQYEISLENGNSYKLYENLDFLYQEYDGEWFLADNYEESKIYQELISRYRKILNTAGEGKGFVSTLIEFSRREEIMPSGSSYKGQLSYSDTFSGFLPVSGPVVLTKKFLQEVVSSIKYLK